MEIIKAAPNINFVGKMKLAFASSLLMIIISIASVIWHGGLNFGIDFSGGTLVQIKFQKEPPTENLRKVFSSLGFENSIIQQFGEEEVVVRTTNLSPNLKDLSQRIEDALNRAYGKGAAEIQRVEVVGP
ncbi:MAG: protein translocase subunit SecF, partial [Syntrophales bacterium]|nr:protein translocase subunit SecF [Syntrophales bacterium]